ncbi:MAG: hypothetical protein LQ347_006204 [Umbilicaria vellea]|nr:MAG: hypothetical protein LQ347_006204 [Umbilicaria vellea]
MDKVAASAHARAGDMTRREPSGVGSLFMYSVNAKYLLAAEADKYTAVLHDADNTKNLAAVNVQSRGGGVDAVPYSLTPQAVPIRGIWAAEAGRPNKPELRYLRNLPPKWIHPIVATEGAQSLAPMSCTL